MKSKTIFAGTNTSKVAEPSINASNEFLRNLTKLNVVEDNYVFDALIPSEELVDESSELEAKFEYQQFDVFEANNWTMLKYLGDNGQIVRKFMSRTTAENVRSFAVESFMRTSLENKLWQKDNEEQLKQYEEYKNDPNVNLIISDEDQQFQDEIFQKQKLLKSKEMKDEDEEPEEKKKDSSKKKSKKKKKTIEIVFNNQLATSVTTDKGIFNILNLYKIYISYIFFFVTFFLKFIFIQIVIYNMFFFFFENSYLFR